ncbi:RcnB family protein [Pseudomonas huanghezhanensis]|uniref:RcnB family protein n=1 Tax=Pseudomonas huanghezhanensis TaxID=3002903 RepID=UPI0022867D7A|nr:RcnB family protein [Pseudomonas sp. BSw22131]
MTFKSLLASMAVLTCLTSTALVVQAQTPATKSVQAEHTNEQYKVGDTAHKLYQDERVGIKDWKDKGLHAPKEGSQWVTISDRYVLVDMDTGKILDMAPMTK